MGLNLNLPIGKPKQPKDDFTDSFNTVDLEDLMKMHEQCESSGMLDVEIKTDGHRVAV